MKSTHATMIAAMALGAVFFPNYERVKNPVVEKDHPRKNEFDAERIKAAADRRARRSK